MCFTLCSQVAHRDMCGEYLIFSGLSRQTLIVHPDAFNLVQLLNGQSRTYHEILAALSEVSHEFKNEDLADFVSTSIEQFMDFGILDQSGI